MPVLLVNCSWSILHTDMVLILGCIAQGFTREIRIKKVCLDNLSNSVKDIGRWMHGQEVQHDLHPLPPQSIFFSFFFFFKVQEQTLLQMLFFLFFFSHKKFWYYSDFFMKTYPGASSEYPQCMYLWRNKKNI